MRWRVSLAVLKFWGVSSILDSDLSMVLFAVYMLFADSGEVRVSDLEARKKEGQSRKGHVQRPVRHMQKEETAQISGGRKSIHLRTCCTLRGTPFPARVFWDREQTHESLKELAEMKPARRS